MRGVLRSLTSSSLEQTWCWEKPRILLLINPCLQQHLDHAVETRFDRHAKGRKPIGFWRDCSLAFFNPFLDIKKPASPN